MSTISRSFMSVDRLPLLCFNADQFRRGETQRPRRDPVSSPLIEERDDR